MGLQPEAMSQVPPPDQPGSVERKVRPGDHSLDPGRDLESLRTIADLYPVHYSKKLFSEWRNLFHDEAIVIRLERGRQPRIQSIDAAMPEQIEYGHENQLFIETWHDIDIKIRENTAIIIADYMLEVDLEIRKGVDILTLAKVNSKSGPKDCEVWKIVTLTYEEKECLEKTKP